MGGSLYKRLHPKVTVFLTNADGYELSAIIDRIKRVCPACKIINILWFEECFKFKDKVPFGSYEI